MLCATINFHIFFLMVVMWIRLPGNRAKNFHCACFVHIPVNFVARSVYIYTYVLYITIYIGTL